MAPSIPPLTPVAVAEFAAQPFIRKALGNPFRPSSVLGFFYGLDYENPETRKVLKDGSFMEKMMSFWYTGHPDYDKLCAAFVDVIRASGRGELHGEVEDSVGGMSWDSVDGRMSRLLLCDQLARNCFRGTTEAFAYDEMGISLAKDLATDAIESTDEDLMYGSYACFCCVSLMHSEEMSDHVLMKKILDWGPVAAPNVPWALSRQHGADHTAVIERFGRYPHRNKMKGRSNTPEEDQWLADVDNLPGWAKSQILDV